MPSIIRDYSVITLTSEATLSVGIAHDYLSFWLALLYIAESCLEW
jgi:hypothetical protein